MYFFLFIVSKQKQGRVNSKASTVKQSYKIFSELVAGYYSENESKEKEILKTELNWIWSRRKFEGNTIVVGGGYSNKSSHMSKKEFM